MIQINSVVFDLGNVLIDWDPRYLYRKLFQTEAEVEWFLENICDHDWNLKHDSGQLFSKGILEKSKKYPEYSELINAWYQRWEEMLGGPIDESVQVLTELKESMEYAHKYIICKVDDLIRTQLPKQAIE